MARSFEKLPASIHSASQSRNQEVDVEIEIIPIDNLLGHLKKEQIRTQELVSQIDSIFALFHLTKAYSKKKLH